MGPILRETTLSPLARQVGTLDDMPYYKLSHPEAVTEGGGLRLFTDTQVGERLLLMYSSQEGLLQRSLNATRIEPEYGMATEMQPFGALVIFVLVVAWLLVIAYANLSINFIPGWGHPLHHPVHLRRAGPPAPW